ncbi:cyclin2 related protein [Cardiosporidium cionae]|uniref:Cyclin2 related protein n=1 Tax=Cardiosporidium cionae TaxID=476202 RepID=A0ABQ7J483_9APIC|nr:cyclin2 related protein [Cardiosporidium cionae]|eukprot:KAF8817894.1 cyclin2 related protein [Cardiosporidium cionae]
MSDRLNSFDGESKYVALPTENSFIPSLATVLTHLVSLSPVDADASTVSPGFTGEITRFHGIIPPSISVRDYLKRIAKYFRCSNECFVLSLVYIDRIVKLHDEFAVSILNIHRLLVTSVMLAAKFFDDLYYSNAFYARVGGIGTREMNLLEAHFLSLINYQLFVSPEEYDQYRQNVLEAVRAASAIRGLSPSLRLLLTQDSSEDKSNVANAPRTRTTPRKFQPSVKHATSPKVATETSAQHFLSDSLPDSPVGAMHSYHFSKDYSFDQNKSNTSHILTHKQKDLDYEYATFNKSTQVRRTEELSTCDVQNILQFSCQTELPGSMNEKMAVDVKHEICNENFSRGSYRVRMSSIEEKETSECLDTKGCTVAYGTVHSHRAGNRLAENDLSIQDVAAATQLYPARAF